MYDLHVHIALSGGAHASPDFAECAEHAFKAYLANGVTHLRDGGFRGTLSADARVTAAALGLNFKTPIRALVKKPGYGAFLGDPVSGLGELRSELESLFTLKPDFLKIIQSGTVSFNEPSMVSEGGFNRRELEYILAFANERELKTMVHCNGSDSIGLAIELGVSSIEHGYGISRAQLPRLAERGIIFVPTFAPLCAYRENSSDPREREIISDLLSRHALAVKTAQDCGVCVAIGSDAGAPGLPHGTATSRERRAMMQYGTDGVKLDADTKKAWELLFGES